jgi:hypothetical protein
MKKSKIIILSLVFLFLLILIPTFGRYASKQIKNYYLNTKNFYFNSDKLEENGIVYQVENWSGVDSYKVTFNMDSYKNNTVYSNSDIEYEIKYSCSENVTCDITKTTGIIYADKHTDSFTVTITPKTPLDVNEMAWIDVEATSISPYKKVLKGKFNVAVGKMGLAYEIIDKKNNTYFEVSVTNTLDYYVNRIPYGNYKEGDKIDINTYLNLSTEEKNNFASSIVTIEFSPEIIFLDMTSSAYLNAIDTDKEIINGSEYINKISFKVDALSSYRVKFYKVNTDEDYTYPFENNESIVNVSFD